MADTRANIALTKGVWTNLYAASSIAVGTACIVYNKGTKPVLIAIKATAPTDTTGSFGIPVYNGDTSTAALSIPSGASGLWAWQTAQDGFVLVQD